MKKCLLFIAFGLLFTYCSAQKLEVVLHLGVQYYGISYIHKTERPRDFKITQPELEGAAGIDLKFRKKHITHVFSAFNPILGASFTIKNSYAYTGITPYVTAYSSGSGPNLAFFSYSLEHNAYKHFKFIGRTKGRFYYSGGLGIAINRSKNYYNEVLIPRSYGRIIGESFYYQYDREYYRKSPIGILIPIRGGINFYNGKGKNFLALNAYWNQGTLKMAEYHVDYAYGYLLYPQYQRSVKGVVLKSRATSFGFTLGVPIRIIK